MGPETNRNEIISGLSFSKTEGKYKTSIFCFLHFYISKKLWEKLSQPKISCDFLKYSQQGKKRKITTSWFSVCSVLPNLNDSES